MIKEQFLNLDLFIPVYYYFVHEKVKYNDFCDSPCSLRRLIIKEIFIDWTPNLKITYISDQM